MLVAQSGFFFCPILPLQARYVREVTLDFNIGIDKFSGSPTMTVLTDKHGNLVTATPGVIK